MVSARVVWVSYAELHLASAFSFLRGASLAEGYLNQRKSNNLRGQALGIANQSYADRAGLRKLGVAGMMDQTPPDLTSTFAQPSNPYRKV